MKPDILRPFPERVEVREGQGHAVGDEQFVCASTGVEILRAIRSG
jgi:hypothetical protein